MPDAMVHCSVHGSSIQVCPYMSNCDPTFFCSWAFIPAPAFFEAVERAFLQKKHPTKHNKKQQQQQGLEPIHVPAIIYFYSMCKLTAAPEAASSEFHQELAAGNLSNAMAASAAATWTKGMVPADSPAANYPSIALIDHLAAVLGQDMAVVPAAHLPYWTDALCNLSPTVSPWSSPDGSPGDTWVPKQQWLQQLFGVLGPQLERFSADELAAVGHLLIEVLPEGKVGSNLATTGDWWELYCKAAAAVTEAGEDDQALLGVLRGLSVLSARDKYVPEQLIEKVCSRFGELQLQAG